MRLQDVYPFAADFRHALDEFWGAGGSQSADDGDPGWWAGACPACRSKQAELNRYPLIVAEHEEAGRWSLMPGCGCGHDAIDSALKRVEQTGGAELLEIVSKFIERFIVLPSKEHADLIALWVLHTHAIEAFWATPYLRITSAAPGSGKTLLLEILEALTRRGWHAVNPSVAVLYRKIDRSQPTLLLDELDNYPLDDKRDALSVLNSGYKRGATVDRCKENGDLESFSCYCPKAYAGLDKRQIVDTLLSRSITIRLEKRLPTEPVEMWIAPLTGPEAEILRGRLERWAETTVVELEGSRPELPDGMINREAEVWWSLLAVAEYVGDGWSARTIDAWKKLASGGDATDDESEPVQLLTDIRAAFNGSAAISTANLLGVLNGIEESPWGARRRGEGLDARGLARMLRPFGIKPKGVRVGDRRPAVTTSISSRTLSRGTSQKRNKCNKRNIPLQA
jgi:hypothetical protein